MSSVTLNTVLGSLAIVAVGWLVALGLHYALRWIGRKADLGRFRIDGLLLRVLGPPISVLVALISVYYALYRIPQVEQHFDQWEGAQRAVLILTGTWVVASLAKNLIREYGLPLAERTDTDVDERVVGLLDLIAVYIIWIAGILVALREVGIQVTAFVASLGIVGLAVALAAKTILSNVLTGVTLTADRNFRVGDRIEVGDYIGDVLEINLHKTIIRTRENEIVLIPNDVLGRKVIINHMLPQERTRAELSIGVAYGTDLDEATTILEEVIQASDRVLPTPEPEVNVASLGDDAVLLRVLVWIDGPRGKRKVRDRIYRKALTRFDDRDIEIPFPQRVVHLSDNSSEKSLTSPNREDNDGESDRAEASVDTKME